MVFRSWGSWLYASWINSCWLSHGKSLQQCHQMPLKYALLMDKLVLDMLAKLADSKRGLTAKAPEIHSHKVLGVELHSPHPCTIVLLPVQRN